MLRKIVVLGTVILIFGLFSLCVVPAQGKFGGTGYVGYYEPNFGEINEQLAIAGFPTFKGGRMEYGIGISFIDDVDPQIEFRLEYSSFAFEVREGPVNVEVKATPIILSTLYRFSPRKALSSYLGVGMGVFPSKFDIELSYEGGSVISKSWKDSPIPVLVLGGVERHILKNLVLKGEVRYVSATATFRQKKDEEVEELDCDWDGFMGNVWLEYSF